MKVAIRNSIILLFCFFLKGCFSGCDIMIDKDPHPDSETPTNKSVHIQNNTNVAYKNNGIYCVSLNQEVKTGEYVFLFYSLAKKLSWWGFDYTLADIDKKSSITKKWTTYKNHKDFYEFYIHNTIFKTEIRLPKNMFKHTGNIFYLLYLDGGKRKVFFGHVKSGKAVASNESIEDSSGCYYLEKYLDLFVKDTQIILEKDSASSNHKVVNPLFWLSNGEKVNLATLPIKQVFIKYDDDDNQYDLVRIADFE